MDSEPIMSQPQSANGTDRSNMLIIVLIIILVLSLLGINVFTIIGNGLQQFINIFNPAISKGLSDLGYASGNVIDKSSDLLADTSKTGIDILNGTVQSVGDLLIKASGDNRGNINQPSTKPPTPPQPAETTNPIVASTHASNKSQWCLVGEYNGARGCINISDQDKCLSGQVFPNQQMCLNPNLTQNAN